MIENKRKWRREHRHVLRVHISVMDLLESEDGRKSLMENDTEKLLSLLHEIGFQREYVKYRAGEHRPLTSNKIVDCGYFESYERTDADWLNSDLCSLENAMHSYLMTDREMYCRMFELNYQPVFTTGFAIRKSQEDYIADKRRKKKKKGG